MEQDSFLSPATADLESLILEKYEPIAIVGIGIRLPGDNNSVDEFRDFLRHGGDAIVEIPSDRWDINAFYSNSGGKGKIRTRHGGYLRDIRGFDSKFFNISPKEADYIDPQQRLLLETAWEALEHSQTDIDALRNCDGGVYIGVNSIDFALNDGDLSASEYEGQIGTGTTHSALSGRMSYFLGWRGPSVSIDTACSSSLAALHFAMQALRRKECSIALCGGVNTIHHPLYPIVLSQANMLSPDGRCKTFDDKADGYGRSEGCATVVLKRLSDALQNGDRIVALLRGSSINQDGESGGLSVPNGTAQELVMRRAISSAALRPADIGLVEAHGTGTSLGDPIEVAAINNVFWNSHNKQNPIRVSSVKGNIGHMEAAAGIVGVIKAALQLQNADIFPHIGMQTPSRYIPWEDYVVEVPVERTAWADPVRRCIVNSFGFTGTIASVVLEQPPQSSKASQLRLLPPTPVLTLSAKSRKALGTQVENLRRWLIARRDVDLHALAHASNRRTHFPHRVATPLFDSYEKVLEWLDRQQQLVTDERSQAFPSKFALLFTGQGVQYPGMGYELYTLISSIRQTVDLCDSLFIDELGQSIKDIMFAELEKSHHLLRQPQYAQPALFTLEYALAQYWISLGVQPNCLLGHGIGEIVAACIAGLFTLHDAVRLVASRSRLMQSVDAIGGMLSVHLPERELSIYLSRYPRLDLVAVNSPVQCVISGDLVALGALQLALQEEGIETNELNVSHAFHSREMNTVYASFRSTLANIQFHEPQITIISNLSGDVARFEELADIEYWVRHIEEPVRFAAGIQTLASRGHHLCIEVGPSHTLCVLGKQTAPEQSWVPSLVPNTSVDQTFGRALTECYSAGLRINWKVYHQNYSYPWLDLPFYAFERRSHWLPSTERRRHKDEDVCEYSLLGVRQDAETERIDVEYLREISARSPAYLAEHQVMQRVVFPGAGYVETLIAAQLALFGEHGGLIHNLKIHEPLYLDVTPVQYTTICTAQTDGSYGVRIVTRLPGKDGQLERLHVSAILFPADAFTDRGDDLKNFVAVELDVTHRADDLYPLFDSMGLRYGDAFQGLNSVRNNEELAIAEISGTVRPGEYLGPTILDAAMQSIAVLMPQGKTYLPFLYDSIRFFKQPRGQVRSVAFRHQFDDEQLSVDLLLLDGERVICIIRGLKLKSVGAHTTVGRNLYHELVWKKCPLISQTISSQNSMLIFGATDQHKQTLTDLADRMRMPIHFCNEVSQVVELLRDASGIKHVIYHWQPKVAALSAHYSSLLDLVKMLDRRNLNVSELRLWLVTELAQVVDPSIDAAASLSLAPEAASMWGFGHSLLNEYPLWRVTLIDLPDTAKQPKAWEWLMQEILANSGEYFVAYRSGQRYVRRLIAHDRTLPSPINNFELQVVEYGPFEHIKQVAIEFPPLAPDEVTVAVRAAGLNFKDVLNALGLLRKHAEESGIEYMPRPLGFEASGEIVAVGAQANFQIGEEVMLSHPGCFKKYFSLPAAAVVRKPANLSHIEAAGIPAAYISAHYALHELAKIRAGDRILIHAAAGGVGQAAVQLARLAGAEIFVTASPHKWPLLRGQGVKYLMSSRSLKFRQELLDATKGEGVDIVFNSLNKDYIAAGLDCLRSGGKFVELGKTGIWNQKQVDSYRAGISYFTFDLSELPSNNLLLVTRDILEKVAGLLAAGKIEPLPTTSYDLDDIQEAFSTLSRGENIGKIVLSISNAPATRRPLNIDSTHTYLITGGFGALGQALVGKLVELGSRHIALCGRRFPDDAFISKMRASWPSDVHFYLMATDISDACAVETLFSQLTRECPPLGGVFHAAGVLADAPVKNQELANFSAVFAAKIDGTAYLLNSIKSSAIFFVGFSSAASVLGSAGQSNYAAANAYIDHRLCCEAETGRQCLSINWGPWADIGMAADLNEALINGVENKGVFLLKPKNALRALVRRLRYPGAQSMIGEFDWPRYIGSLPFDNPFFSLLDSGITRTRIGIDLYELTEAAPGRRRNLLLDFLRTRIAEVLHFDSMEGIEPDAQLHDLGLDSLDAIELKNSLELTFRVPLSSSLVFDYPSIPALLDYLAIQLWPTTEVVPTAESKVAALSEIEIDRELEVLKNS